MIKGLEIGISFFWVPMARDLGKGWWKVRVREGDLMTETNVRVI